MSAPPPPNPFGIYRNSTACTRPAGAWFPNGIGNRCTTHDDCRQRADERATERMLHEIARGTPPPSKSRRRWQCDR